MQHVKFGQILENACRLAGRNPSAMAIPGDWKVLAFNVPTSLGWAFIDSGEISIADYAGKKVQIGFHYTSTAAKAGTWEVDNFVLYGTK